MRGDGGAPFRLVWEAKRSLVSLIESTPVFMVSKGSQLKTTPKKGKPTQDNPKKRETNSRHPHFGGSSRVIHHQDPQQWPRILAMDRARFGLWGVKEILDPEYVSPIFMVVVAKPVFHFCLLWFSGLKSNHLTAKN